MFELLQSAASGRRDTGFEYLLSRGDLRQMSAQKTLLVARGFNVGQVGVYPALRTESEYVDALRAFWEAKVNGWWNYQQEFLKHAICSEDEYKEALRRT